MNILAKTILQRVFDRIDTGGGGILHHWPALAVILILSVVAARVMAGRRPEADGILRAP